MKYIGYINYFLDGVLKTHHFKDATVEQVDNLVTQLKNKPYQYVGLKKVKQQDQ